MAEITLEALVERIRCLEQLLDERIDAISNATTLARDEMNRRLEGMNEFREQLNAQVITFPTKLENDLVHTTLIEKLSVLDERIKIIEILWSNLQGRFWALAFGLSVATIFMPMILKYLKIF